MDIELHNATGNEDLDHFLRGLVRLFEISFPTRIRSYYLGGSYSDGTAVGHGRSPNASDVDVFVIFRGKMTEDEIATFTHVLETSRLTGPISLDAQAYSEDDLLRQTGKDAKQTSFMNALIRVAGRLLYGDDLRAELPPVLFPRYVLDVIESGIFHLGIPRQKEALAYPLATPLEPPLEYPDPEGEFYGYDAVPARPGTPPGTRVLVALTAWIATLILALKTGHYAGQKSQSLQLCKKYLPGDKRTQLAATINDLCKGTWGYMLPDSIEDRKQLRVLCRKTLALENEYLRLCQDYVFTQLQQGGEEEQRQATRILQSVHFTTHF